MSPRRTPGGMSDLTIPECDPRLRDTPTPSSLDKGVLHIVCDKLEVLPLAPAILVKGCRHSWVV